MAYNWRILLKKASFFLIPAVLSPLLFFGKELKCAFVILVMSMFWLTDVVPLGITSLLPLLLLPFLDISDAKTVSQCFFKDNVVLFMASLIMAMAVEETNLHRRIALSMLRVVGSGKLSVLMGIMATTAFVSFFVSDTAATTLMLPIAIAILSSLQEVKENVSSLSEKLESGSSSDGRKRGGQDSQSENSEISEKSVESIKTGQSKEQIMELDMENMSKADKGFCKAVVLAVSHASLIGGTGIITGTGTNLVFREQLLDFYPDTEIVSYVQWMAFALPFVPVYLLAAGIIVTVILMPRELIPSCLKRKSGEKEKITEKELGKAMKAKIREAHKALGSIRFGELSVLLWLVFLLLAWSSRHPGFVDGWGKFLPENGKYVKDSTVAVGVAILMFIWPKDPRNDDKLTPILGWASMKMKYSWSCTLLIGAGFAISDAVKESGLGNMIACGMNEYFVEMDKFWLQVLATTVVCFITEFASNVAAAGIFVPIMLSLSQGFQLNPLYLVLPVTISCSFAFMFPMATPGNAIVYDTKIVSLREMMLVGLLLNFACISITILNFNTYAYWLMDLGKIPPLLSPASASLVCSTNSTIS